MIRSIKSVLTAAMLCAACAGALVTPVSAANAAQEVIVIEQPLEDFLKLAGRQFGVQMNLPRRFKGAVRNEKLPAELNPLLRALSAKFSFDWYREGNTVYISPRARSVSKMIYLRKMSYQALQRTLDDAGVEGDGFKLAHVPSSNSLLVSGPPSLIAKIELLADGYNKNAQGFSIIRYGSGS